MISPVFDLKNCHGTKQTKWWGIEQTHKKKMLPTKSRNNLLSSTQ